MGWLNLHLDESIVKDFSLVNFIETGTHMGDGVIYALSLPFQQVISFELNASYADRARARISEHYEDDLRWKVFTMDSVEGLQRYREHLVPGPAFWWVDAHLASIAYDGHGDNHPAIRELQFVKPYDVVVMDDLKLYGYPNEGDPELDDSRKVSPEELTRIIVHLGKTHDLEIRRGDTGVLIAKPWRQFSQPGHAHYE